MRIRNTMDLGKYIQECNGSIDIKIQNMKKRYQLKKGQHRNTWNFYQLTKEYALFENYLLEHSYANNNDIYHANVDYMNQEFVLLYYIPINSYIPKNYIEYFDTNHSNRGIITNDKLSSRFSRIMKDYNLGYLKELYKDKTTTKQNYSFINLNKFTIIILLSAFGNKQNIPIEKLYKILEDCIIHLLVTKDFKTSEIKEKIELLEIEFCKVHKDFINTQNRFNYFKKSFDTIKNEYSKLEQCYYYLNKTSSKDNISTSDTNFTLSLLLEDLNQNVKFYTTIMYQIRYIRLLESCCNNPFFILKLKAFHQHFNGFYNKANNQILSKNLLSFLVKNNNNPFLIRFFYERWSRPLHINKRMYPPKIWKIEYASNISIKKMIISTERTPYYFPADTRLNVFKINKL